VICAGGGVDIADDGGCGAGEPVRVKPKSTFGLISILFSFLTLGLMSIGVMEVRMRMENSGLSNLCEVLVL